jgi:hypothetical protein
MEHKTKVVPVINWANGTVSKSFREYLNNITEEHDVMIYT